MTYASLFLFCVYLQIEIFMTTFCAVTSKKKSSRNSEIFLSKRLTPEIYDPRRYNRKSSILN